LAGDDGDIATERQRALGDGNPDVIAVNVGERQDAGRCFAAFEQLDAAPELMS
jgi:hypothetical protein